VQTSPHWLALGQARTPNSIELGHQEQQPSSKKKIRTRFATMKELADLQGQQEAGEKEYIT